jgi:two-component system NarL family response regulator
MTEPTRIRVLLADDHPVVRGGLAAMVGQQPVMAVVAEAGTGEEAVRLFAEYRPDVTLLDLRMPGLDGADALDRILTLDPAARVVILTTFDGEEDVGRALKAGAKGYLLKDAEPGELLGCIRTAHAGKTCVAPAVAARLADRLREPPLTARELDVLRLLAAGKANKEIAAALFITEATVKAHVANVYGKLGVQSRTEAVNAAVKRGLVRLG